MLAILISHVSYALNWQFCASVTNVFSSSYLPKRLPEDRNFLRCRKTEKSLEARSGCRVDDQSALSQIPSKRLLCVEPFVDEHFCHGGAQNLKSRPCLNGKSQFPQCFTVTVRVYFFTTWKEVNEQNALPVSEKRAYQFPYQQRLFEFHSDWRSTMPPML
ncbi:hypothetical protein TNCV_2402401 [Trichonephila clavipes]|nr:hypothetical protein TNCV_2402401 [Trichonephila clavipes]